jgi:4-amino-4-deoxy-L-arabinose transferase-like glycosyltransferase
MRAVVWVVLVACGFRLVFAACTGLGIDESYMVASSQHFAASYFDHPLAAWWLELAARRVFGSEAPWAVRLPFVILSAVSSWLLWGVARRLYGERAAFWAVACFSISPVFSLAFGCWVLPDGPLDAALLAAAWALARALGVGSEPAPRWWWAVGLFAGLAMLSKYNAALVLAGGALAVLTDPASRHELRRLEPWGAVALAVLMFMPVLGWNFAHHWASFGYQGGRAAGLRLRLLAPFSIWGGEALFVLPWLWLPMVLLLARALWRGPAARAGWLLAMMAVIPVVLFAAVGVWSSTKILYHWAAPGYLMLFPMLGNFAAGLRGRRAVAGFSALLLVGAVAVFIAAELSTGLIPRLYAYFPAGKSPLLQAVDWDSLNGEIPAGVNAVAALRWYDAGKIGYALHGRVPVTVFGSEPHEFGISVPVQSLIGKNVLLVAMPGNVTAIHDEFAPDFARLLPGPGLTVIHAGSVLLVMPTFIGIDLINARSERSAF